MIPGIWRPELSNRQMHNYVWCECRCVVDYNLTIDWYLLPANYIWYLAVGTFARFLVSGAGAGAGTSTGTGVWAMWSAGAWEFNCNLTNWLPNNQLAHIGGGGQSQKLPRPFSHPRQTPFHHLRVGVQLAAQIVSPKSTGCENGYFAALQSSL